MNVSTIDVGDVTVGRPGSPNLRVTGVTVNPATNGSPVMATYAFNAPGGSWSEADNGTYEVRVRPGAVADLAGRLTPAAVGTFAVSVPVTAPPAGDATPPTAVVAALPPVTAGGRTTQDVQVTYTDDTAVDVGSVDVGDVTVTFNGTALPVVAVSANPPADGRTITAIYTVTAPGTSFGAEDNGTYAIAVNGGAVVDTSGNPLGGGATGSFEVVIPGPKPPLDPTFGGGGVTAQIVAEASAVQPDGRVIVAGRVGDLAAGTSRGVLQRFNPDGSVDRTFGTNGQVVTADGSGNDAYYAVELAPDGGIVVAGTHDGDFAVTRFRGTGAADRAFGTGGRAVTNFGGDDVAYDVAVAPDGSVVAGGSTATGATSAFALARYHADGKADVFFGEQGRSIFEAGTGAHVIGGVALQADGKVVAASASGGKVAVARVGADGERDAAFGANGVLAIDAMTTRDDLGRPDHTVGVVLQTDGKAVVSNRSAGGDFAVARVTPDGRLDNTFGTNGITVTDFGGDDDADDVIVQGTGEILAVGTTSAGGAPRAAVAAFGRDGSLDENFGTGGTFTVDTVTTGQRALHVGDLILRAFGAVGPDGRLLVGTSDQGGAGGGAAASQSGLRRINVPGSGLVGRFGQAAGSKARGLGYVDADGTGVTLTIKGGGTARAFSDGRNLDVVVSGSTDRTVLTIKARGGDGRVTLRNLQSDGAMKCVIADTADLTGTAAIAGGLAKARLGSITGTLAAAGSIGTVMLAGDLNGGRVLAGANLGADGTGGGDGSGADGFAPATIGAINVRGQANAALVAAGLDPRNGVYLDADDVVAGGPASRIGPVTVRGGADAATRFVAGSFAGPARLPSPEDPAADARFQVL